MNCYIGKVFECVFFGSYFADDNSFDIDQSFIKVTANRNILSARMTKNWSSIANVEIGANDNQPNENSHVMEYAK